MKNNRVPLRQQVPFAHIQQQPIQEVKSTPDFVVPVAPKAVASQNLNNKAFLMALRKSFTTGGFALINQELKQFPTELFKIDEINLDGEQWWNKMPITKIDLSNNHIPDIPTIENLTDIQVLRMDSNLIQSIAPNFFESLPNLKSLSLMKNKLQSFHYYWAPHLVELVLSENQIREFLPQQNINQNFLSLEILDLRQNQLTIAPFIASGTKLKRVNLQQNKITALHNIQFFASTLIEEFHCSKNEIEYLEEGFFEEMRNLKLIDLKENRLKEFTQEQLGLSHPQMDSIMLSFNQLQNYTAYQGVETLSVLLLNNNKIKQLDYAIIQMKGIRTLDLSNNDLSDLPSELSLLPQLVRIQLEGNPLKCIRQNIRQAGAEVLKKYLKSRIQDEGEIKTLEKQLNPKQMNYKEQSQWEQILRQFMARDELVARDQKLTNYDDLLFQQVNLRVLDLSNNQLGDLPPQISVFKQLMRINMNNNRLKTFPFGLAQMQQLTEIELAQNQIVSLEFSSQYPIFQSEVRHLNLSMNKISQLPAWVAQMPVLGVLNISYNQINSIDVLLYSQSNIEVLDVSNNLLTNLNDNIYHNLPKLNHLNLANNNLQNIPSIIGFIQLRTLQVEGNPIKTMNRAIVQKGTVQILDYLRTRHPIDQIPQRNFGLKNPEPRSVQKYQEFEEEPPYHKQNQRQKGQQQIQYQQQNSPPQVFNQQQQQQSYPQQGFGPNQPQHQGSVNQFSAQIQQSGRVSQAPFQTEEPPIQRFEPEINIQQIQLELQEVSKEIQFLERQIQEDFTLNKFQIQEKRRLLQQKMLLRSQLQQKLK